MHMPYGPEVQLLQISQHIKASTEYLLVLESFYQLFQLVTGDWESKMGTCVRAGNRDVIGVSGTHQLYLLVPRVT